MLTKTFFLGEIFLVGDFKITIVDISRDSVHLEILPDNENPPISGLHKKQSTVRITDEISIFINMKPSQLSKAVLGISAPRKYKIEKIETELKQ